MTLVAENSTEHCRFNNRPRNRNQPITNPNQRLPKPFSSSHTRTHYASGLTNKMNKLTSMAFNRLVLGCGSLSPEIIQSEATKARKQKARTKKKKRSSVKKASNNGNGNGTSLVVSDMFCAPPGIGFSSDAAFVDCVQPVGRRNHIKHSGGARQDRFRVPVSDGLNSDEFNVRPHCLLPQYSPKGFSEEMMSHSQGMEGVLDQFGELRLDVDNMSYEELVDLSDKMGYVGTGLRQDEMIRCLRLESTMDGECNCKCSICQEEYEVKDEMGRLKCGHCYHIGCIKPWLLHKNSCPICKAKAAPHYSSSSSSHGF